MNVGGTGRIVIVKVGSTMPTLCSAEGDFEDWVAAGLGIGGGHANVVDVRNGAPLPPVEELSGAVITGSHDMVTSRLDWSELTAAWISALVRRKVPVLGICYGHQLLAHALGGAVGDNPQGLEFGTVDVRLTEGASTDALLGGFRSPIKVHVSHAQTVLRLPPGARLLAYSERDRHQAFLIGESAWGVQFHPEFNAAIARAYVEECRNELLSEGQDPDSLAATCADTPYGPEILRRFATVVSSGMLKRSL